jgi:hypothetical protein
MLFNNLTATWILHYRKFIFDIVDIIKYKDKLQQLDHYKTKCFFSLSINNLLIKFDWRQ